jgi:hypothetical protein
MARSWHVGVALVGVTCLLLGVGWPAGGGQAGGDKAGGGAPGKAAFEDGPFSAKYLVVGVTNLRKPAEYFALETAQIKRLGDRYFLVGKVIPGERGLNRWDKGVIVWLPVGNISEMAEFRTLDGARKAYNDLTAAAARPFRGRAALSRAGQ